MSELPQQQNKRRFIIALGCFSDSGKSTCARYLSEILGHATILSFAKPAKDAMKIIFRLTDDDIYTQAGKESVPKHLGIQTRQLMQLFCTEVCREALPAIIPIPGLQNTGIWVWNMEQRIAETEGHIIIDDLRFEDEAVMLRKYGAIIVHVNRPRDNVSNHKSEQGNIKFDYVINNTGTKFDLQDAVAAFACEKITSQ